jgi:hypothetical protein
MKEKISEISKENFGLVVIIFLLGVLWPLSHLGELGATLDQFENSYQNLALNIDWIKFSRFSILFNVVFSIFSIFSAYRLIYFKNKYSLIISLFAAFFWLIFPFGYVFSINILFPGQYYLSVGEIYSKFIISSLFCIFVMCYVGFSRKIRKIYFTVDGLGERFAHEERSPVKRINGIQSKEHENYFSENYDLSDDCENDIYEKIYCELNGGGVHKATWMKAYSDADGDEGKAKAQYIRIRYSFFQGEQKKSIEYKKEHEISFSKNNVAAPEVNSFDKEEIFPDEKSNFLVNYNFVEFEKIGGRKLDVENVLRFKEKWLCGSSFCGSDFVEIVKFLIECKASGRINFDPLMIIQYRGGNSLLHEAAKTNNIEAIEVLLDAGMRKNLKNRFGKYPYQLSNNSEVVELLKVVDAD